MIARRALIVLGPGRGQFPRSCDRLCLETVKNGRASPPASRRDNGRFKSTSILIRRVIAPVLFKESHRAITREASARPLALKFAPRTPSYDDVSE